MYSTIRATVASNSSRVTFDSNFGASTAAAPSATGTGPRKPLAHRFDLRRGVFVGGIDPAVVGEGAGHDRQLVVEVVEDEQDVGDHQRQVGQAERIGVGRAERLDRAHQVVAEQADGATGERRQAGHFGHAVLLEVVGDRPVRIGRVDVAQPLRVRGDGVARVLGQEAVAPAEDRAGLVPRNE